MHKYERPDPSKTALKRNKTLQDILYTIMLFNLGTSMFLKDSYADPDWIRIEWGLWIQEDKNSPQKMLINLIS